MYGIYIVNTPNWLDRVGWRPLRRDWVGIELGRGACTVFVMVNTALCPISQPWCCFHTRNSVEQSFLKRLVASQRDLIPRTLSKPKVPYRSYKDHRFSKRIRCTPSSVIYLWFHWTSHLRLGLRNSPVVQVSPTKSFISLPPHSDHMSRPSDPPWFDRPSIFRRVKIMKTVVMH
jgi:hypothetical protein